MKKLLKAGKQPPEVVEELYLRCFGRKPSAEEMSELNKFLADAKDPEPVLSDLFWALLNSKEFIFNH